MHARQARRSVPLVPFHKRCSALVEGRRPELVEGPSAHQSFAAQSVWLVSPEQLALPSFRAEQPVLVLWRDIHRHLFAREAVDRLRSEHADVLVVDMGWPSADRKYADLATFGASRLMGRVLLKWLHAP